MKLLYLLAYMHLSQAQINVYDVIQDPVTCGEHKSATSCSTITFKSFYLPFHKQMKIPEPPFTHEIFEKTRQWSIHGVYLIEKGISLAEK